MHSFHSKITERGQTSIPAQVRKQLDLKTGQRLSWSVVGGGVRLVPVPDDPVKAFQSGPRFCSTNEFLKVRNHRREK